MVNLVDRLDVAGKFYTQLNYTGVEDNGILDENGGVTVFTIEEMREMFASSVEDKHEAVVYSA